MLLYRAALCGAMWATTAKLAHCGDNVASWAVGAYLLYGEKFVWRLSTAGAMAKIPKLRSAPAHFNKGRELPSSSRKVKTTSRSVHISVPTSQQATPRTQSSYISLQETTPQPVAPSSRLGTDTFDASGAPYEPSDVYFIHEDDVRRASKRQKVKVRIRRVRFRVHYLFSALLLSADRC